MKYNTIIFDLDGTLLDTIDDIVLSVNLAYEKYGYHCNFNQDDIRRVIGRGADKIFSELTKKCPESKDDVNKIYDAYMEYYKIHQRDNTKLFPNVEKVLIQLKKLGYNIGVISNKPDIDTKRCINHYLGNIFDFVVGGKDDVKKKPHREVFDILSKQYGFNENNTIYVGDMIFDKEFANNVGMDFIYCKYGYGKHQNIEKQKYEIEEFEEILKVIK